MGIETYLENKERYKEEGSQYNMCQAIREMWEDGWSDGIAQGFALSAIVFRTVQSGLTDNQKIAEQCSCTVKDVENIRKAFEI
ncbi:MAG: hypothetical protein IJZ85_00265 [Lachnospiraceae bacterium]|nr:hypothetical protein [Lachnospiraceae bacterium]